MFKRIINILVWTIVGLYTAVVILLHIPFIQNRIGECVSDALCRKFGTKVTIWRVDLGFINRLIVDDTYIHDQNGKQMLKISRTSVKIDLLSLLHGKTVITSAQFFGMRAYLYKVAENAKPNYQFVLDSLASKDTTKHTPLDLKINSLIIRRGSIKYQCLSKLRNDARFNPNDIETSNISAHFIINKIADDSVNVKVKKLSLDEKSGLHLKSLSFHFVANKTNAALKSFSLKLPHTQLYAKEIDATYAFSGKSIELPTLQYNGAIDIERATPSDFAFVVPKLKSVDLPLFLHVSFNGTSSSITASRLTLGSDDRRFTIDADGSIKRFSSPLTWNANLRKIQFDSEAAAPYFHTFTGEDMPEILKRLGNVTITGYIGADRHDLASNGKISTALGDVSLAFDKHGKDIVGHIDTKAFNLKGLTANDKFGNISADININGRSANDIAVEGRVNDMDYDNYHYKEIVVDALYRNNILDGHLDINDPNINLTLSGVYSRSAKKPQIKMSAQIKNLSPQALNLTRKWHDTDFALDITADITGTDMHNADGEIALQNFKMHSPEKDYGFSELRIKTGFGEEGHYISAQSDFGHMDINGHFDFASLTRSITNLLQSKLPTIPGLEKKEVKGNNNFAINAVVTDTEWLRQILDVPISIGEPFRISGTMDSRHDKIDIACNLPAFTYKDATYKDASLRILTPDDSLHAEARIKKIMDNGKVMSLSLNAGACDNRLKTSFSFMNNERHPLKGIINASSHFAKDEHGVSTAYIDILESKATIGDTTWHVKPSNITYKKNRLEVDGFAIQHGNQYLAVDGTATKSLDDSLHVNLSGIDVSYILNLVNFHSVDFYGAASGHAYLAGLFSGAPQTAADLTIKDFKFETGRMGTLYAHVGYNDTEGRIEIDAKANDEDNRHTIINGYVSPRHNYIDLGITAQRTRAEFMESFCGSFMDNVKADINGELNVVGPLNNINLVGKAAVDGSVRINSLNTTYWMRGDSVRFVPDEIKFMGDTIYDRNGNIGILSGSVYHKHLTNLSYDLSVKAKNLLAYDTHTFGENTFYGTAYTTGDCRIKGKSGEVTIDIQATPNANSILVYNVSDRNELSNQDFIQWRKHPQAADSIAATAETADNDDHDGTSVSTDIKLNFLINCNTDATIKLLMDEQTGDYITLNGDGVIRASYFNKGAFDMYGNYVVDHGLYKLTIQNIIKKDFEFQKGGTIAFGGNPYNAALDLKAQYVLNGVSLSDLNIGRSFSNNNIRVNCLMNVSGTPFAPKVDFSLDMPSLSNDAKQMVYSLLNAEEEMNQQVLYLLAVGRFYNQGNNNSASGSGTQYSQTSLAMQSFLSGTISQQLNTVLSNVINNNNWNFGANISTGTEGFNNAEYEGLLSGRLLNNRLLLNGQFGYRDKANATTSFIGDFDLRYLLFPNGNLAINVYNKTNDRYFTRNSLNTQGIGIIMKKDFNGFLDLFFNKKRKKK